MDESVEQSNLQIRELNLIDVSFEDDSLINFAGPLEPSFSENQEQKQVRFLDPFDSPNAEASFNSLKVGEQGSPLLGSSETEKGRSVRCFLEPDELSSMIGGTEKSSKHVLPGIEEDIHRSTDSLSTLSSDTRTLKSLEGDLFEDVRASIQKSSMASNVANSNSKKKLGVAESQTIQCEYTSSFVTRENSFKYLMMPKAPLRKPSVGTQGSGKATKQSVAKNDLSTRSPCKPPRVVGRNSAISNVSTKRSSLGANRIKLEKDNSRTASVRVVPAPKVTSSGSSQNVVPRPTPPSRSLHSSAATKTQLTTSCSSLDSSGSGSSGSTGKLSLNSLKRNESRSRTQNCSSSGSTVKSLSKTESRSKSQSESSNLTAYLRSATKASSSRSPASSISEWSSESTSSTATAIHRPKSTRTSLDSSSSVGVSVNGDAPQVLDSHNNSKNQCSVGDDSKAPGFLGDHIKGASMGTSALLCPASSKPSGLRMPSPKIGFFDGVRSASRTPPGSLQSHSSLPSALSRIGAASISPSAGSNKAKLGKSPSAKTISVQSTQQTALNKKIRPSLSLQSPSNAAVKVSSVSRNVKSPLISPKFQNRISPKTGKERHLKAGEAEYKVHDISTLENPLVLQHKMSPESEGTADALGTEFNPMNKSLDAFGDLHSACDAENINPSQKGDKDAEFVQHLPQNDLYLLTNNNEKEQPYIEDQVNCLSRQVGAMDMNVKVEKTVTSLSTHSILTSGAEMV
ncbi:hypothetical protein KPL71_017741 [Citrus sinensis]|uniref:Uncharacterized protein n=1 Tax=Citrus sinensis TaxID=2711 RepID=A0ACB8JSG8_CITSI|nr:hypothetical protein KPL71_017741 [Citrus sinensis]